MPYARPADGNVSKVKIGDVCASLSPAPAAMRSAPSSSSDTASAGGRAPGGAGSGAGAATPACPPALAVSDDEEVVELIAAGAGDGEASTSPLATVVLETLPSAGRA